MSKSVNLTSQSLAIFQPAFSKVSSAVLWNDAKWRHRYPHYWGYEKYASTAPDVKSYEFHECCIFSVKHLFLYSKYTYFFSQASKRAGILNPRIWLVNHALVTGSAFYDMAHRPDFFSRCSDLRLLNLKVSGNRQSFALITLPSTISQRKFISVHFKMARKVAVSKFNWVFWSCESLLGCL